MLGSAQQDAVRRSEVGRARLESVFARPDRNRRDAVMPAKLHRAGEADTDLDPRFRPGAETEGIVDQNIAIIARYSISAVIPLLALPKFVDRRKNSIDLPLIR